MRLLILCFSIIGVFTVSGNVAAYSHGESRVRGTWEDGSKKGWFWYEKKPSTEEEKEEEKEEKAEEPRRRLPSLKDYTMEELWNMHPDDFQALLEDFRKKAVMEPSVENVTEYYVVQDIARRKALAFANVSAFVMQAHPELSVEKDYPTVTPGRNAMVRQRRQEIRDKIVSGQEDFALIYFYSPDCPYCLEQSSILSYFEERYGWRVKRINRDEKPGLAARFGVQVVPHLMLIYRHSQDYLPVATGVVSLDALEKRLYRGMRLLAGEISPEEWSLFEFEREGAFDVKTIFKNAR